MARFDVEQQPNEPQRSALADAMRRARDAALNQVTTQNSPAEWLAQRVAPDFKSTNQAGIYADEPDLASLALGLQAAYHGTPHAWEGPGAPLSAAKGKTFDLSKMGSGEGAQAYGWGAYATKEPAIAEKYRSTLSRLKNTDAWAVNGRRLTAPHEPAPTVAQQAEQELAQALTERPYDPAGAHGGVLAGWRRTAEVDPAWAAPAVKHLESMDPRAIGRAAPEGRLYKLEAPEDAEMLHWDKPVSAQPQPVMDALEKAGIIRRDGKRMTVESSGNYFPAGTYDAGEVSGRELYQMMHRKDAEASAALRSAGIPGHLYRGDTSGVENMVIYDPARAPVTEAYPSLSAMSEAMARAKAAKP